jgi:hypothetical protein
MPKAFVYTELHATLPFTLIPWAERNAQLAAVPGLRSKTWLSGVGSPAIGGLYEFDDEDRARAFLTGAVPATSRALGVSLTTRLFDGDVVAEASRQSRSAHFGAKVTTEPGAFVYAEAQLALPFDHAPWRWMTPMVMEQPGFLHLTWLSGVQTQSIGGFYAFDTLQNATEFCTDFFPGLTGPMGVAHTTRLFDAAPTVGASRGLNSPFFV